MSYCVNCGVELAESSIKCPLCDTPVLNPNVINMGKNDPPFPEKIVLPKATKNKYGAIILTLVMLIPNIVCMLTNILFAPETLWSIYVVSSSVLAWFLFVFPFLMKKKNQYLIIFIDAIVTAAYIFLFYYYNSEQTGWFWKLALPLVIGIFAIIAVLAAYFSKKRTLLQSTIATFAALTVTNAYICTVINIYSFSVVATYITTILGVSSLIFLLFFVVAAKNSKLRAWLSRKFFF